MEVGQGALETLVTAPIMFKDAYRRKRVLVTGHTGFKGSWLCEWLLSLGADVTGYSLAPEADAPLFDQMGLARRLEHRVGDIRDRSAFAKVFGQSRPDFVFHLAAQPLVRRSYREPFETFETNAMGTAVVLEALRSVSYPVSVVIVTTDKCYRDVDKAQPCAEDDPMGGHDPYSASKALTEIVTESYRKSFFSGIGGLVRIATARAGNVIGGGDWSQDRIVPDIIRSVRGKRPVPVRNPRAIRPWQHVLEPLGGYLWLAACLDDPRRCGASLRDVVGSFNFGPDDSSTRTVGDLVDQLLAQVPGARSDVGDPSGPHEAQVLRLSIEKAARVLAWHPVWSFETAVERTGEWYLAESENGMDIPSLTRRQIAAYEDRARGAGELFAS